jgi:hypothetical protein
MASGLQFAGLMKHKLQDCLLISASLLLLIMLPLAELETANAQKSLEPAAATSPQEKRTIAAFENRVKQYLKLRDRVKGKVPKLSKDSTPEQIQANEKAFVDALRTARANAKPGEIFTADIAAYIRTKLKTEFKGSDRKEIRKIVLDDEIKPIPIRVNYPYPDENAFAEMPPTLLLKLPVLPKQVKYRYVGRNLFLVDTDNNLIIDYMLDALP